MATITLNKTARTIVASTSNAADSTTRGTLDLRTAQGGILTGKIANGATGPTAPSLMTVSIAHANGTTPAAAAEGADWKRLYQFSGTTTNSDTQQWSLDVPPGVMHLQVEFAGNTGQAVTVEAFFSEITSAASA
jgi:hypothetical protein